MAACGPRTCVVLQPGYLPWLGFFDQLERADEFVFLDDVQFDKHGWRNRNRIKGPDGPQWLTVPVRMGGRSWPRICDVTIDSTQRRWVAKHLQSLRSNYGPCPFFDWLYPELEAVLRQPWERIADLDIALVSRLCNLLGLRRSIHRSSPMDIAGDRCERLVEICRRLGCDHYYSGVAARDYLDVALFERAHIGVEFQEYVHPEYAQRYGAFVSHLSVVDLMFNCGPGSLGIICTADAASPRDKVTR
jgi:hypothetical protein